MRQRAKPEGPNLHQQELHELEAWKASVDDFKNFCRGRRDLANEIIARSTVSKNELACSMTSMTSRTLLADSGVKSLSELEVKITADFPGDPSRKGTEAISCRSSESMVVRT